MKRNHESRWTSPSRLLATSGLGPRKQASTNRRDVENTQGRSAPEYSESATKGMRVSIDS